MCYSLTGNCSNVGVKLARRERICMVFLKMCISGYLYENLHYQVRDGGHVKSLLRLSLKHSCTITPV